MFFRNDGRKRPPPLAGPSVRFCSIVEIKNSVFTPLWKFPLSIFPALPLWKFPLLKINRFNIGKFCFRKHTWALLAIDYHFPQKSE